MLLAGKVVHLKIGVWIHRHINHLKTARAVLVLQFAHHVGRGLAVRTGGEDELQGHHFSAKLFQRLRFFSRDVVGETGCGA